MKQIVTIHGHFGKCYLPLVYILLPNKEEVSYRKALQEVKKLSVSMGTTRLQGLSEMIVTCLNGCTAFHTLQNLVCYIAN